tara:strand:+ start:61 stop:702 length:642 start_codon:yes stop_codon:yes gene_type:complete
MEKVTLFVFFIILGYSFTTESDETQEIVTSLNSQQVTNLQLKDTLKPTFSPDSMLNGIVISKGRSTVDYLGTTIHEKWERDSSYLPYIRIESNDSKQLLTAYAHPGSSINDISEFKIEYKKNSTPNIKLKVKDEIFKTESGISLGINLTDLKSIKGKSDTTFLNQKILVIKYWLEMGSDDSGILEKYNMPSYYSNYYFQKGMLIKFEFGFDYP